MPQTQQRPIWQTLFFRLQYQRHSSCSSSPLAVMLSQRSTRELSHRSSESSTHRSNSYEWGSSWRTPSKARLCKTWLRLITSPLSLGSDGLLLLLLKAPPRELWKRFSFHLPPLFQRIPLWRHRSPLPSSRMGSSRASNTGETQNNWEKHINQWTFSFSFLNWFPWFLCVVLFSPHTPSAQRHYHPQKHICTPFTVVHFYLTSHCREKVFPTMSIAVTIVLFEFIIKLKCSWNTLLHWFMIGFAFRWFNISSRKNFQWSI